MTRRAIARRLRDLAVIGKPRSAVALRVIWRPVVTCHKAAGGMFGSGRSSDPGSFSPGQVPPEKRKWRPHLQAIVVAHCYYRAWRCTISRRRYRLPPKGEFRQPPSRTARSTQERRGSCYALNAELNAERTRPCAPDPARARRCRPARERGPRPGRPSDEPAATTTTLPDSATTTTADYEQEQPATTVEPDTTPTTGDAAATGGDAEAPAGTQEQPPPTDGAAPPASEQPSGTGQATTTTRP